MEICEHDDQGWAFYYRDPNLKGEEEVSVPNLAFEEIMVRIKALFSTCFTVLVLAAVRLKMEAIQATLRACGKGDYSEYRRRRSAVL
jgi:hypothetical protein